MADAPANNAYGLSFQLSKMDDSVTKKMYQDLHDYGKSMTSVLIRFTKDYCYISRGESWFARLYAQKTKMAIDVKGSYTDFANLTSINPGSEFKTEGRTLRSHRKRCGTRLKENMRLPRLPAVEGRS